MGVVDAINTILSALPARWPLPLPIATVATVALALAINSWVTLDMANDAASNSELLTLDPKCRFTSFDYIVVGAESPVSAQYHGKGGLLNVATHDYMPGVEEFLAAAQEKGYTVGDYNGVNQEVFSKVDVTTQDGWRESTYRAYYKDTGKPSNLCIKKYALVTKINFRPIAIPGKPRRAVGVTYQRQGLTRSVTATKEIILSAGAFGSAKILLLSGVGPAAHLRSLKGYHCSGCYELSPQRKRVLAAPDGLAGAGFFTSPVAQPSYPDLQVVHSSVSLYPELP
ncbi:Glucose dehydrogenase [FAD, quinone] [Orchesella cincta]|uniref:Glucose dehydrogenase [FAD, quinone] n=1 Tax=Orchesella cincta TaxID=48709 RepID=A0A1D2MDR7_ORCCI|nr:Glucose dehydrogenase [FAD, quinone] [Orchesella cincta]